MTLTNGFVASRHKEIPVQDKEGINHAYYYHITGWVAEKVVCLIKPRLLQIFGHEKTWSHMIERHSFIFQLKRQIEAIQHSTPNGAITLDDFFSDTVTARLVLENFRREMRATGGPTTAQKKFHDTLVEFISETEHIRESVVKIIEKHRAEGIDIDIEHIARQETRRIFDVKATADVSHIPRIIAVYLNEIVQWPYDIERKIRILSGATIEMQYLISAAKNEKLEDILHYFIKYIWKKQLLLEKKIAEMEQGWVTE